MKIKFLFWNIRRGLGTQLASSLTRLADTGVDVFLFAECPDNAHGISTSLNASSSGPYVLVPSKSSRVKFYSRQQGVLNGATWSDRFYDEVSDRITAIQLQPLGTKSVLIVGAHLHSPSTGISEGGRCEWARRVARDIQTIEGDVGHSRTVFVGDLNMNPFDLGLVSTSALHAVMSRGLAQIVGGHKSRKGFPIFYNPMWSYLGDRHHMPNQESITIRPSGTHYFDQAQDMTNFFWQMYDQVLVRPDIMDNLVTVEIMSNDGHESLVTNDGRPRTRTKSDHLPLYFEIDIRSEG